jgi:imidazoleglycerol phosphate synthase glutamine amidotransferase subunit HisH
MRWIQIQLLSWDTVTAAVSYNLQWNDINCSNDKYYVHTYCFNCKYTDYNFWFVALDADDNTSHCNTVANKNIE